MTFAGRQATLAPSLTAAQPASYSFEGRTVRPLGGEIDRAFALMATWMPANGARPSWATKCPTSCSGLARTDGPYSRKG